MLLTPLPYEYLSYLDPGDRQRRARSRPTGIRIRRQPTTFRD
jgi:hypothetical protein